MWVIPSFPWWGGQHHFPIHFPAELPTSSFSWASEPVPDVDLEVGAETGGSLLMLSYLCLLGYSGPSGGGVRGHNSGTGSLVADRSSLLQNMPEDPSPLSPGSEGSSQPLSPWRRKIPGPCTSSNKREYISIQFALLRLQGALKGEWEKGAGFT